MAYCCLVERYIQLAGRALQFADFDLPTVGGFAPLPPGDLLHAPLEVDDLVSKSMSLFSGPRASPVRRPVFSISV